MRTDDLTWRELDGETIILDLRSSRYLKTNQTGTLLLNLLTTERDRDELVAAVIDAYGVSPERAVADVDGFLAALGSRHLLELSEADQQGPA